MMIAQLDADYIKTRPTKAISRITTHLFFQGRPLTTRYRWLNPPVLAELSALKKLPYRRSVKEPIFIVGTGRSGSTIVGKTLSMHADVGFLNEPKALWHAITPQEDVSGIFTAGPAKYRFDVSDATPQVRSDAHAIFGVYLSLSRAHRVLDKNPEIVFRIPFVRAIFPDAKFIFLTRDGWDTAASIARWTKEHGIKSGNSTEDWWGLNNRKWRIMVDELVRPDPAFADAVDAISKMDNDLNMAVVEWIVTMREGLANQARYPDAMYLLRYESLVANPRNVFGEVLDFCDLKDDSTFLDYAERALQPTRPYPRFDIEPALLPLFEETRGRLEYV